MKALVPVAFGLVTILFASYLRQNVLDVATVVTQPAPPVLTSPVVPPSGIDPDGPGRRPASTDDDPVADEPVPAPAAGPRNRTRYQNPRRPGGPPPVHPAERLLNQSTSGPAETRVP